MTAFRVFLSLQHIFNTIYYKYILFEEKMMTEHLTEASFKEKIFDFDTHKEWKFEGELPALVDFYADWCVPCKMLGPAVEEVSNEFAGQLNVYKVDTEAEPTLSQVFGIQSIPTLLFVPKDGEPRIAQGALPKAELKRAIAEVLGVS
jgi:thioredoxin 1